MSRMFRLNIRDHALTVVRVGEEVLGDLNGMVKRQNRRVASNIRVT